MIVFSAGAMEVSDTLRRCYPIFPEEVAKGFPFNSLQTGIEIFSKMKNSADYKLTAEQKWAVGQLLPILRKCAQSTPGLELLSKWEPDGGYCKDTDLEKSHMLANKKILLTIKRLESRGKTVKSKKQIIEALEYLNDTFLGTQHCQQARDKKRKLVQIQERKKDKEKDKRKKVKLDDKRQQPITNFFPKNNY